MFSNAKTVKAPSSKKKAEKAEVQIDGIANLAAIDAVIKSLQALRTTVEADIKSEVNVQFLQKGCAAKKRPDNFKGIDTGASSSCELRIRSSASKLSDDEANLLKAEGISTTEVTEVIETYIINPAYKDDGKLLALIETKLKGVKGIPEDFIQFQEGKTKTVVGETALDEVFALDIKKARTLLPLVGVLALKPKQDEDDLSASLDTVQALLGLTEEKVAA